MAQVASNIGKRRAPTKSPLELIRRTYTDSKAMLVTASAFFGSTIVSAGLGFVYWWVAARLLPPAAVGFAAACVAGLGLVSSFSQLGMQTVVLVNVPRRKTNQWRLISTCLLLPLIVGTLLGLVYGLNAARFSASLALLVTQPLAILVFAFGGGLTAMANVLDNAFIGLLRGQLVFQRNLAFGLIKLAILVIIGLLLKDAGGFTLFYSWVAGILLACVALGVAHVLRARHIPDIRPEIKSLKYVSIEGLKHTSLNLARSSSGMILPVVATSILNVTTSAYFYTAWMIAGIITMLPTTLSFALLAASAGAPRAFARKVRLTLVISAVAGVGASAGILVLGRFMLSLFGPSYESATTPLFFMVLVVFPASIQVHYVVIQRLKGRDVQTAVVIAIDSAIAVVCAAVGAKMDGLLGMSIGWLIGNGLSALPLCPMVWRAARGREDLGGVSAPDWSVADLDTLLMPALADRDTLIMPRLTGYAYPESETPMWLPAVRKPNVSSADQETVRLPRVDKRERHSGARDGAPPYPR